MCVPTRHHARHPTLVAFASARGLPVAGGLHNRVESSHPRFSRPRSRREQQGRMQWSTPKRPKARVATVAHHGGMPCTYRHKSVGAALAPSTPTAKHPARFGAQRMGSGMMLSIPGQNPFGLRRPVIIVPSGARSGGRSEPPLVLPYHMLLRPLLVWKRTASSESPFRCSIITRYSSALRKKGWLSEPPARPSGHDRSLASPYLNVI
mmetsp:Transcript_7082/g.18596  ORF Transcript_7082/g.18596 Transcript_7082/m.18596 type:complete len:207 (+) Transcript_7082:169-789(+)